MILIERARATEKTLNKFRGKEFEWGTRDCITLARTQLVNMGHKVKRIPRYSGLKTAIKRLNDAGHKDVESLISSMCLEIPPSLMIVGDLASVKGEGGLSALVVCVGNKFIGYPSEHPYCSVVDLLPERAWRV